MVCVEYMSSENTRPEGEVESQTRLDKGPQCAMLSCDSLALWPLEPCIYS